MVFQITRPYALSPAGKIFSSPFTGIGPDGTGSVGGGIQPGGGADRYPQDPDRCHDNQLVSAMTGGPISSTMRKELRQKRRLPPTIVLRTRSSTARHPNYGSRADSQFVRSLVRALKLPNSFYYPFLTPSRPFPVCTRSDSSFTGSSPGNIRRMTCSICRKKRHPVQSTAPTDP